MKNTISAYLDELSETIGALSEVEIGRVVDELLIARGTGNRVFVFGNGGSAATAIHFANDLNKLAGSVDRNRLVEAHALTNLSIMTALANDHGYEHMFSEQLGWFAKEGDVAFGISCSGKSTNVTRALDYANVVLAMRTCFLTGNKASFSSGSADCTVFVPHDDIRIQEDAHLAICHIIAGELRDR